MAGVAARDAERAARREPDQAARTAVSFSGAISICNPLGACQSPRPATSTVYLDYMTGSFIETSTDSAAP